LTTDEITRGGGRRWFVNGAGDIGGLDTSVTGQALAAVGYSWTKAVATTFGYRVLYAYAKRFERQLPYAGAVERAVCRAEILFLTRTCSMRL
jgi:hypothetical protein